jgi:hypothetical protein
VVGSGAGNVDPGADVVGTGVGRVGPEADAVGAGAAGVGCASASPGAREAGEIATMTPSPSKKIKRAPIPSALATLQIARKSNFMHVSTFHLTSSFSPLAEKRGGKGFSLFHYKGVSQENATLTRCSPHIILVCEWSLTCCEKERECQGKHDKKFWMRPRD